MNKYAIFIINVFILALIFIIYYYFIKNNIDFFDLPNEPLGYNSRINYINKGTSDSLPWEHHAISSIYPVDISINNTDNYYYEYENAIYETKLRNILYKNDINNLIKNTEGIDWSDWIYPENFDRKDRLLAYYNKIYDMINTKINASSELKFNNETDKYKIQIVHDVFKRYKLNIANPYEYLFDIDMLLYREGKINGKHINIIVKTDGDNIDFVIVKILGIVNQDNIYLFPILANDRTNDIDNVNYTPFISTTNFKSYLTETENESYMTSTDFSSNEKIESILYNKIINNYDGEHDDRNTGIINKDDIRDFKINLQYTEDQSKVRKEFLEKLNDTINDKVNSNNIYKNYPYKSDVNHAI